MTGSTDTGMKATIASASSDENQSKFLTFCLGREEYGVEILRVREIIGLLDITPLPRTPDYVKGVINLRGRIIPVIDLRCKFALPEVDYTQATCIIVLEVGDGGGAEPLKMGVIVDTVSEVLDIPLEAVEPAPDFGCSVNTDYVKAIGKTRDRVITLLEIDRVLEIGELATLSERVAAGGPGAGPTEEDAADAA